MKKFLVFVLLLILIVVSSSSAQTCNCEDLQAQIDSLTERVEALEAGTMVTEPEKKTPRKILHSNRSPLVILPLNTFPTN